MAEEKYISTTTQTPSALHTVLALIPPIGILFGDTRRIENVSKIEMITRSPNFQVRGKLSIKFKGNDRGKTEISQYHFTYSPSVEATPQDLFDYVHLLKQTHHNLVSQIVNSHNYGQTLRLTDFKFENPIG